MSEKRDVLLQPARCRIASTVSNRWAVTLDPRSMVYEDVFTPRFWSVVGVSLTPGDIIDVRTDEGDFYAELYVVDASRTHASVVEMRKVDLTKVEKAVVVTDLEYKWKGPTLRHCVVRKSDGAVQAENLGTKADALSWIAAKTRNEAA